MFREIMPYLNRHVLHLKTLQVYTPENIIAMSISLVDDCQYVLTSQSAVWVHMMSTTEIERA